VSKSVVFAGTAPVGGIPNLAASASLFVFSSVVETQALSVIEALAAGTPVVAVDSPATHDVLSKGGGVLVPPDEKAFAETVVKLLNDPRRRQVLSREARKTAEHYSIPEAIEKLLAVYHSAIRSKIQ